MKLADRMQETGRVFFRWRSYLPLLFLAVLFPALFARPGEARWDWLYDLLCLALVLVGVVIRILVAGYAAPGTSGRNTREQRAESLNTTGLYSLVRHPLYLGNFLIWMGLSIDLGLWWYSLIAALVFWIYYENIMLMEERFLETTFGPAFLAWAENTPAFIPRLSRWQRPERRFSWRRVLRKEYSSAVAVLLVFAVLEVVSDGIALRTFKLEIEWLVPLGLGLVGYAVLWPINRWTRVLREN